MATKDYAGNGIVVHWDSARCFHSGRCFNGAPEVFDPKARPWVVPDGLPADALATVIDMCPSGALTYTRTDGARHGRRGHAEGADPTAALAADTDPPTPPPTTFDTEPAPEPGADPPHPTTAAVITPRADGPLLVKGPVVLTHPDGSTEVADRLFLCRCGRSGDKPRCDGTHKRVGFQAPGAAPRSRTAD